jgi:hypothetical protein
VGYNRLALWKPTKVDLFVLVVSSPAVLLVKTTFGVSSNPSMLVKFTTPYGVDPSLQLHENTLTY